MTLNETTIDQIVLEEHEVFEPKKINIDSSPFLRKIGLDGKLDGVKYVTVNPAEIRVGKEGKPYRKPVWAMIVWNKEYFKNIGITDLDEAKPVFVNFPMGKNGQVFFGNSEAVVTEEKGKQKVTYVKPQDFIKFLGEEHAFVEERLETALRSLMYAIANLINPQKEYKNI